MTSVVRKLAQDDSFAGKGDGVVEEHGFSS
jgi:hypothetical protein